MKATTWFCPVLLTLLCVTRLVCTAQRGGYPLDYVESNLIQDDYLLEKRNKPSLSIVNPLDVLRQRLLLEIARRQMKENTRQVELNRAILKNVGKRMLFAPATRRYQMALLQHQPEQQLRQLLQQHSIPNQLVDFDIATPPSPPAATLFDFLQQQQQQDNGEHNQRQVQSEQQQLPEHQRPYKDAVDGTKKSQNVGNMEINKQRQRQQHNGNEIENETNRKVVTGADADYGQNVGAVSGLNAYVTNADTDVVAWPKNVNDADTDADADIDNGDDVDERDANEGFQLHYLYRKSFPN